MDSVADAPALAARPGALPSRAGRDPATTCSPRLAALCDAQARVKQQHCRCALQCPSHVGRVAASIPVNHMPAAHQRVPFRGFRPGCTPHQEHCPDTRPSARPCGALQSVAASERVTAPRGPPAGREKRAAPAAVTNSCPMSCTALTAVRSASSCGSEPWQRPHIACQTRPRITHAPRSDRPSLPAAPLRSTCAPCHKARVGWSAGHRACGAIGLALHAVGDALRQGRGRRAHGRPRSWAWRARARPGRRPPGSA